MKALIVDTNILISYSRGKSKDLERIIAFAQENNYQLAISPVVIFEYWAGRELDSKKKTKEAQKLLSYFLIIEINAEIAKKAAELFRKEKIFLPLADLLLAASAILTDAELVTYNLKHFQKIKGLKLFDLKKI